MRRSAPRTVAAVLAAGVLAACTSAADRTTDSPFAPDQGRVDVSPDSGGAVVPVRSSTYSGDEAAQASVPGGSDNRFARLVRGGTSGSPGSLAYAEGDELWFGVAIRLPAGFYDAVPAYFSPLRWDTFGVDRVSRSGLALYEDGAFRLFVERQGEPGQDNLLGETTLRLDEERWYWLEIHQRLSSEDGQALNTLFVDEREIATSTRRNYYGDPVSAVRYGIVALSEADQAPPLTVLFDRPTLGPERIGPVEDR